MEPALCGDVCCLSAFSRGAPWGPVTISLSLLPREATAGALRGLIKHRRQTARPGGCRDPSETPRNRPRSPGGRRAWRRDPIPEMHALTPAARLCGSGPTSTRFRACAPVTHLRTLPGKRPEEGRRDVPALFSRSAAPDYSTTNAGEPASLRAIEFSGLRALEARSVPRRS